eukprot:1525530-Rhodomonas_salina.1
MGQGGRGEEEWEESQCIWQSVDVSAHMLDDTHVTGIADDAFAAKWYLLIPSVHTETLPHIPSDSCMCSSSSFFRRRNCCRRALIAVGEKGFVSQSASGMFEKAEEEKGEEGEEDLLGALMFQLQEH